MPVSIGIAPTKTLAKVANKIGKNKASGVCELCPKEYTDYILSNFDIADIWSIGRQLSKKLNIHGIYTAKQLSEASDRWVRKLYNVGLERTVRELRGEPCIDFETAPTPKTIIVSRMFGKKLYNQSEIGEALAKYCGHAATKLRKNNLVVKNMTIFIQATEGYGKSGNNYSCRYNFDNGTDSAIFLSQMAHRMLEQIFRPSKKYLRAGIMLDQLTFKDQTQYNLFNIAETPKQDKLMAVIDKINNKFGNNKIGLLSAGINREWKMKQEHLSPSYMTKWKEIPRCT